MSILLMSMFVHYAIHINNSVNKNLLLQQISSGNLLPELTSLKGAFFSISTLQHYIDEEIRHERFLIKSLSGQSVSSMSEGEQKKILLQYLVQQKPGYLIIDNVFDNLDAASQKAILEHLNSLQDKFPLIQLFNRRSDLLPFIKNIYSYSDNTLIPYITPEISHAAKFSILPAPYQPLPEQKEPLIKLSNISVEFDDKKVLQNIDWEIKKGEFWQLMGPNGSGKSTLLTLITGDSPKGYNQELYLFGQKKGSGETVWDIKKRIGYFTNNMVQQFSRGDSVERMILSGFFDSVGLYVKPSDRHRRLAEEWLQLAGLYEFRKDAFLNLSPGHQRLVLVIRAMVKHPPVLILDEPTAGLDDNEVELFASIINKIAQAKTSAIIYVSHRKEKGLEPDFVYELIPDENGSLGRKK